MNPRSRLQPRSALAATAVVAVLITLCSPVTQAARAAVPTDTEPPAIPHELSPSAVVTKATVAGYLSSSGAATPSGAFAESVPLDVPQGRRGMQPRISLEYSSKGDGNGPLGVGWSLAGVVSQFERCPRTLAQDGLTAGVRFEKGDRFCLDGQRLVKVGVLPGNTSDEYGADKTEYRTELNSFEKIVALGGSSATGPDTFTVTTKDAVTRTYTARTGARNVQGVSFDSSSTAVVATDPSGTSTPKIVWLLTQERDLSGNTISSSYDEVAAAKNEFLISWIDYTGSGPADSAKRHVDFAYESDPAGTWSTYQAGVRYQHTRRLKTISMSAPNPAETQKVWSYNLAYEVGNSHRSLLASVEKCGQAQGCLRKKLFTWNNPPAVPLFSATNAGPAVLNTTSLRPPSMRVADFDGDGKDDMLYSRGGPTLPGNVDQLRFGSALSTAVNLEAANGWVSPIGSNVDLKSSRTVDANGDGTSDLLIAVDSNTDPGFPHGFTALLKRWDKATNKFVTMSSPYTLRDIHAGNFADVNGDAKLDFIGFDGGTAANPRMSVRLGKGDGTYQDPLPTASDTHCDLGATDVDGDGRAEQLMANWTSADCGPDISALSADVTGTLTLASQDFVKAGKTFHKATLNQTGYRTFRGDFNGDGITDLLLVPPKMTGTIPNLNGVVLFNTGAGLADPHTVVIPHDPHTDLRIADVSGDGRDDIVAFNVTATNVSVSNGDGTFTFDQVYASAGTAHNSAGRTTSQVGDFDGDGRTDIVLVDQGSLTVLKQNQRFTDTLSAVQDQGVLWNREDVTYSNVWTNHPERMGEYTCAYPLACPKHGMTVVRKVVSRAHQVDTYATSAARVLLYDYEDPIISKSGRGGLGFGIFREWDAQQPRETVTTFAHRKMVTAGGFTSYPEAGRPATVRTATPILTPGQGSNPPNWPSRVNLTTHTYQLTTQHSGKVIYAFDQQQETKEWEQSTAITWGPLSAGTGSEHITGIAEPAAPARRTVDSSILSTDDYGNVTRTSHALQGGPGESAQTTYDTSAEAIAAWRVSDPVQVKTTSIVGGSTPVTRTVDYHHNSQGLVDTTEIEKADTSGRLWRKISYSYNSLGMPVAVVDAVKNRPARVEHIEYAPVFPGQPDEGLYPSQVWLDHNVLKHRPSTWSFTHPAYGVTLGVEDVNGRRTVTTIDDLGRPVSSSTDGQDPATIIYSPRADAAGGINGTTIVSSNGTERVSTLLDVTGRSLGGTVRSFDGTLATTRTSQDALGRVVATMTPAPSGKTNTTTYVFDSLNRLTKTTAPDGTQATHAHTFLSDVSTDAEGHKRTAVYDVGGRLITSVDALDSATSMTTRYHYGPFGLLDRITDDRNNATRMSYDLLGRRTQMVDPDRGTTDTTYFGDGLVESETHAASGHSTTFAYDDLSRRIKSVSEDGTSDFVWDTSARGIGSLASATSPDAITTAFRFDDFGRASGTTLSDGAAIYSSDLTYKPGGKLDTVAYPDVAGHRFTLAYDYNAAGYTNKISDITGGQAPKPLWRVDSRKANQALDTAVIGDGPEAVTFTDSYHDATGLPLNVRAVNTAGDKLLDLTYDYYANGTAKSRQQNDMTAQRKETYSYDGLNRLTAWTLDNGSSPQVATGYTYDTLGGLTKISRTGGLGEATSTRTYGNAAGTQPHALATIVNTCPVGQTCPGDNPAYDTQGRQISGNGRSEVTYTAFDLPRKVTKNGKTTTYAYDAFGTRVKASGPDGTTFTFPNLYEKRTTPAGATKHIYHLQGTDGHIGQAVYDGAKTTFQYHLTDRLGSVTATTGLTTAGVATVTQSFAYDPFGNRVEASGLPYTGTSGDTARGFTGQRHDDDLGLIDYGGRVYDATHARFLTPDPIITDLSNGQDLNPYSYVRNSPPNYTDPSGFTIAECTANPNALTCDVGGGGSGGGGWQPAESRSGGSGHAGEGGAGGRVGCGAHCDARGQQVVDETDDFIDRVDAFERGGGGAVYSVCQICADANRAAGRWQAEAQANLEEAHRNQAAPTSDGDGATRETDQSTAGGCADLLAATCAGDAETECEGLVGCAPDLRLADNSSGSWDKGEGHGEFTQEQWNNIQKTLALLKEKAYTVDTMRGLEERYAKEFADLHRYTNPSSPSSRWAAPGLQAQIEGRLGLLEFEIGILWDRIKAYDRRINELR